MSRFWSHIKLFGPPVRIRIAITLLRVNISGFQTEKAKNSAQEAKYYRSKTTAIVAHRISHFSLLSYLLIKVHMHQGDPRHFRCPCNWLALSMLQFLLKMSSPPQHWWYQSDLAPRRSRSKVVHHVCLFQWSSSDVWAKWVQLLISHLEISFFVYILFIYLRIFWVVWAKFGDDLMTTGS